MSEIRTTIRLPDDLQKRLKEAADRNRRSVHAQILVCIERGLDEDWPGPRLAVRTERDPGQ